MPSVPPPLPCSISRFCQEPSKIQVSMDYVTKEVFLFKTPRQPESLRSFGTREHFDLRLSASDLTPLDLTLLGQEPRNQAEEVFSLTGHQGPLGEFLSQLKECKCARYSFQVSCHPSPHYSLPSPAGLLEACEGFCSAGLQNL